MHLVGAFSAGSARTRSRPDGTRARAGNPVARPSLFQGQQRQRTNAQRVNAIYLGAGPQATGARYWGIRQFEATPNSRFPPRAKLPACSAPIPTPGMGRDDPRQPAIRWTSQLRAILPFAAHEHDELLFFEFCVPSPQAAAAPCDGYAGLVRVVMLYSYRGRTSANDAGRAS